MFKLHYSWRALVGDLFGGLIAALIAIPYGLALAAMMGLPPVLGLVTSIVTAPITAVLGRNPVLIGGTASATVPFIAHAVQLQGLGGAAKVGAMMVLSQLATMTAVRTAIDRTSNNLLYQSWQILSHAGQAHAGAVAISALVIGAAFAVAHFAPRAPAPLIGVFVAVGAGAALGVHEKEIGRLPFEIPPFAGFAWTPADVVNVLPAAFGLAFVSSVNILITSRVVEHFRGRHKHLKRADADVELGAYGIANVVAGMFAAPMSVGIPARSLASVRCGGSTRLSNIFHAIFILGFLGLGGEYISRIPVPALAGVTAYIGLRLLEWSTWRRLPRMRRVDATAFLATAISVLIVNAVLAVAIGCSFYVARYVYRRFIHPVAPEAADEISKVALTS